MGECEAGEEHPAERDEHHSSGSIGVARPIQQTVCQPEISA
jgi:hypothetical protein